MSHNVHYSGIQFTDLGVLQAALAELTREGLNASFEVASDGVAVSIRGYAGGSERVDAAIKLPNQPYDVGFTRKADGSYTPYFEYGFRPGGLCAEPGAQALDQQPCTGTILGKLQQRYAILIAERNARTQGMSVRRIQRDKGQIALEVHTR